MKNIGQINKYLIILVVLTCSFILSNKVQAQTFPTLQASCQPNTYSAQVNANVGWSAYGYGGNGIYTYLWSGTDGLYSFTQGITAGTSISNLINKIYYTSGTKTAAVTVTSGTQSITMNCGSTNIYPLQNYYYNNNYYPYNNYYSPINGSCSANVVNARVGSSINWAATASGGNGVYQYYWNDSESNSTGQFLSKYYTSAGWKFMNMTITSNGQSLTKQCSIYINPGTAIVNSTYENQVLSYNDSNTKLVAVYLSDVPYTGFDDVARIILFISALILWSAFLSFIFLKRKTIEGVYVQAETKLKNNTEKLNISIDDRNIKQIEDYARSCKVLLSSDAVIRIFKLVKTEKINSLELIKKMSKEDWTAVGEMDIEKFI